MRIQTSDTPREKIQTRDSVANLILRAIRARFSNATKTIVPPAPARAPFYGAALFRQSNHQNVHVLRSILSGMVRV